MKHVGVVPIEALASDALALLEYAPHHVLVALVNGVPCAIEDSCSHAGASLATGHRHGFIVACPLHAYRFDLRTGELLSPRRACAHQRRFEAVVVGDMVHVYDPFTLVVSPVLP